MSNATSTLILMATVLADPALPEPGEPPVEGAVWICHAEHPDQCAWYVEDSDGTLVPHKDEDEHER